ncbi:MAG: alpha-ketoglutarate-dependent dioxygenase AlkB [Immundisolibacter sp.]|uniref:alpha-ketoglutarate-dependent dioxygenase AlkB family protein n=1 Tax=Immundisolibacter sp. TaxID=1934948 RepID=UPI003D0EB313
MPLPEGELYLLPRFVADSEAAYLLDALSTELAWTRHRVRLFGREHLTPRLCAWYGDPGARYAYSGQALEPLPWPPALAGLRARLHTALGLAFNSVLCNLYRDGADSMGWHSDDEASLGPRPVIASLSLGATRRFALRHRARRYRSVTLALGNGDLLLMTGDTQTHWQHAVPSTRRPTAPRINLTFRAVGGAATLRK